MKVSECKVVMLGGFENGKSAIRIRFMTDTFPEMIPVTLSAQFTQPEIYLKNGEKLKMNLWDTSGEERFLSIIVSMHCRGAQGLVFVYSIVDKKSFEQISWYIEHVRREINIEDTVIYLVGNKIDLDPEYREVDTGVAQKFAEEHNIFFTEVSAKTGAGVNELFKNLAEKLAGRFRYSR